MIHPKAKLTVGKNCKLHPQAHIGYAEHGGTITLGNNVIIKHGCVIRTCTGFIIIGDNTVINYNCIMHALGGITIGQNVLLSPNVHIYAQNHQFKKDKLIRNQKNVPKSIVIEEDVWIGANSIILGGVIIHKGAVIGAGSVVTKDIPSYEIWAGNTAKKIGKRK